MTSRRTFLTALLGAATVAVAPTAHTRGGRVRFRGRGLANGTTAHGPVLSREQLRQCVSQQNAINAQADQVDALQAELAVEERAMNAYSARITAQEPLVDEYSQESVDSFNAMVGKHERMVAEYNAKLPAVNSKVNSTNSAIGTFNATCAERPYYESDMQAVLAGR